VLPVILAIALLLGLVWWSRKGKRPRWGRQSLQSSGFKQATRAHRRTSAKVSGKLRRDLIRIAGNAQVAERLVSNLRAKHPDRQENWYWEKAIFDLERDRHY
jgi:cytochrome c biogenesis protein ResB